MQVQTALSSPGLRFALYPGYGPGSSTATTHEGTEVASTVAAR
jgi:hypothetical protein